MSNFGNVPQNSLFHHVKNFFLKKLISKNLAFWGGGDYFIADPDPGALLLVPDKYHTSYSYRKNCLGT
jgi:hypothetical protein